MRGRKWCGALELTFLLACFAVPAAAQLRTGNLYFKAFDRERQALPGATVTLVGLQGFEVQITDGRGEARLLSLPPGEYTLKAEREDILPIEYLAISVNAGRNTQVDMELLPDVVDNNWVFTGAWPLLDRRKAAAETTVSRDEIENLPVARYLRTLLASTPEILAQQDGAAAWSLNGIVISQGSVIDVDALEEMYVTTGGSDAAVDSGLSVNLVTRRGTNEWRGSIRYLTSDKAMDDQGVQAGGPLKKDKAWVWGSYARPEIQGRKQETGSLGVDTDITDSNSLSAFAWDGGRNRAWKIEDTQVFFWGSYVTGLYARAEGDSPQEQIRVDGASLFTAGGLQHELRYGAGSQSENDTSSLYVQDILPLGPVTASVGLRWDRQDSEIGPRLGLTWAFGGEGSNRNLLRVGYSHAKTEEILLGVDRALLPQSQGLVLGLQLSRRRNEDLLAEKDLRGVTLSVTRPLHERWMMRGFFSWQENDTLKETRASYGLNTFYRLAPAQRWSIDLAANLTRSGSWRDPNVDLLDLRVQKDFYYSGLNLILGVDCLNALDKTVGTGPELDSARSRAFRFSARISFLR